MKEESELPPTDIELNHGEDKIKLLWDGFCLMIETPDNRLAFVVSVNDPDVSAFGNVSIIFGTAEEIAQRLPV